jgi:hypothetical protein
MCGIHVPKQLRIKLDDRSEKCIFTGYSEQSKAYRLYNPITTKFIISRDVEFKEVEAWNGSVDKTMAIRETISYGQVDVEEESEQEDQ